MELFSGNVWTSFHGSCSPPAAPWSLSTLWLPLQGGQAFTRQPVTPLLPPVLSLSTAFERKGQNLNTPPNQSLTHLEENGKNKPRGLVLQRSYEDVPHQQRAPSGNWCRWCLLCPVWLIDHSLLVWGLPFFSVDIVGFFPCFYLTTFLHSDSKANIKSFN